MRNHSITTSECVLHSTPDMIARSGLDIPYITSISIQLSTLESSGNIILITNGTASSIDKPSAFLEVLEQISIDKSTGSFVQRAVDSDNVTLRDKFLEVGDFACSHCLGSCLWKRCIVIVKKLLAIKWDKTFKDTVTDAACADGTNDLAFKIKGIPGDFRYLPVSTFNHLKNRINPWESRAVL